jgi:putative sugar O-methyltransferase
VISDSKLRSGYTLVIPTYNRPDLLAALLRSLEREGAPFWVMVLDSSAPEPRARNRAVVAASGLRVQHVEFPQETHPFDKFRAGVERVATPFCGLCADDDLVLVEGIRACVDELDRRPDVSVAHGYYFSFQAHADDSIDVLDTVYYSPSIEQAAPVERLRSLFSQYQALTYGTYRTPALRKVFAGITGVGSLLARELLSGALSVVQGKAIRLPRFTNGRSVNPSEAYKHWHPLEWLVDSPEGLFEEYGRYRRILIDAILASAENRLPAPDAARLVDLVHAHYLIRHAPLDAFGFIMEQAFAGKRIYDVWPAAEIQLPLIRMAHAREEQASAQGEGTSAWPGKQIASRVLRLVGMRNEGGAAPEPADLDLAGPWPKAIRTGRRDYRVHQRFVQPAPGRRLDVDGADLGEVLAALDGYSLGQGAAVPVSGETGAATAARRALAYAAAFEQLQDVSRLVKDGARLDLYGCEALSAAAASGRVQTMAYLHQNGVSLKKCGRPALLAAVSAGSVEALAYLHQNGIQLDSEVLVAAAAAGELEAVVYLHCNGVALEERGTEALVAAARQGHVSVVTYLHENGLDLTRCGARALVVAAEHGHAEIVRYLHVNGVSHVLLSEAGKASITAMADHLEKAKPIYRPSRFWMELGSSNLRLLQYGGEQNFKRTINQSYFNFIPRSENDPLFRALQAVTAGSDKELLQDVRISDPDFDPSLWFSFFPGYQIFPEDRAVSLETYRKFVGLLHEYAARKDDFGILAKLEEPELGNPIRIFTAGRLISQDLLNSSMECNSLLRSVGSMGESGGDLHIAELGAGYGRLAHVVSSTVPCRYALFDIPPALHLAQWYLTNMFPEKRIFRFRPFESFLDVEAEFGQSDIAFFTPDQLELMPDRHFDAFVSISSLHEMRLDQIDNFMRLAGLKTKSTIYLKQQDNYVNPYDDLVIGRETFRPPDGWSGPEVTPVEPYPGFVEMVFRRSAGA